MMLCLPIVVARGARKKPKPCESGLREYIRHNCTPCYEVKNSGCGVRIRVMWLRFGAGVVLGLGIAG